MFCWTAHLNNAPYRSYRHAAVVVDNNKLYSFGAEGNRNDRDQIDVYVFNTVSLRWMKLTSVTTGTGERHFEAPSRRRGHTAVLIEEISYIWGGGRRSPWKCCNVLYAFNIETYKWFKPRVSGRVPKRRCYHSACVFGKVMYIHGGENNRMQPAYNDIYKLDTNTMAWSLLNTRGTPPPVSSYHSANIIGTKMFVFGGCGDQWNAYNSIRVFDTETNCWLSRASAQLLPKVRWGHSTFAHNGELYIFGGQNLFKYLNDLWKFNPETFSWKKVEPNGTGPCSGKSLSLMCCCVVGDRIVLYDRNLYVLDLSPSLKTLCKLSVIQYNLEQSELTHNIRRELAAMTNSTRRK